MNLYSLFLLVICTSMSVAASSPYKMQIQRLQLELLGLESSIKANQKEENELQVKHQKAIVELRDLEDGLREKEEKFQELKNELSHFQRAQRQVVTESHEFQFTSDLTRLETLLMGVKVNLRIDEERIMKQRQHAMTIVLDIEQTRLKLSSLTARARATDLQTIQVNRKIFKH